MDYFRITHIWTEFSYDANDEGHDMIRFEKVNLSAKSWWVPNAPNPPRNRDYNIGKTPNEPPCKYCNEVSPHVYVDSWVCLNPSCSNFWHSHNDVLPEQETLTLHFNFLQQRTFVPNQLMPTHDLFPNVISSFDRLKGTSQAVSVSALLWRGMVCNLCRRCIVRVSWHEWRCRQCDSVYAYHLGALDLRAVISTRQAISFNGHPPINLVVPDDYDHQGPIGRDLYRVDKIVLHDSMVILLSPTARFNEHSDGPNMLWDHTLAAANSGQLDLQRALMNPFTGGRARYFSANFGAEYDFSDRRSTPFEQAPACVRQAVDTLNQAQKIEIPGWYEEPNEAQVLGFMEGMLLDWHIDGETEIGANICYLSLGGDADVHIRLRKSVYNELRFDNIVRGQRNWRYAQELVERINAGGMTEDEIFEAQTYRGQRSRARGRYNAPEIVLPMIHGSIMITYGKSFTKYYEKKIVPKDNTIHFGLITRNIDQAERERIAQKHTTGTRRIRGASQYRVAGQIFSREDGKGLDFGDGDDDEGVDDDDAHSPDDDSHDSDGGNDPPVSRATRGGTTRARGAGRSRGTASRRAKSVRRGTSRGSSGNGLRRSRSPDRDRGRSASPTDSGFRVRTTRKWSREEDRYLVSHQQNSWADLARHFDRTIRSVESRYNNMKTGSVRRPDNWDEYHQDSDHEDDQTVDG